MNKDIFSCRDVRKFADTVEEILPYRGYSTSKFFMCKIGKVKFLTKLCFYRKTEAALYGKARRGKVSQTDAEIFILDKLKEKIIAAGISPCILEILYFKICEGVKHLQPAASECANLATSDISIIGSVEQTFCRYGELVRNGFAYDRCAFLVLERCDISLGEYIRRTINTPIAADIIRSILFMIIYTLYALRRIYPKFRHGDLHTENIMLIYDKNFQLSISKPKFIRVIMPHGTALVPYFGITPKIIDFGFAVLPEENIISDIVDNKLHMFYQIDNDVLMLLHYIYLTSLKAADSKTAAGFLGKIEKLLQQIEPSKVYIQYNTEYIRKVKTSGYLEMLQSAAFSNYYTNIQSPRIHASYKLN